MPDLTPSDIVFQNAGKYLRWQTQETGSTAVNGTPTAGNSGISVLGSQKTKIAVTPNSGATLSFRVWIEYEGRQGFYLADGFTRGGIDTAWTQEINTSGVSRLYVEVTAIDTGNFDVEMAPASEIPSLNTRTTLTNELFLWDALSEKSYREDGEVIGSFKNQADSATPAYYIDNEGVFYTTISQYRTSGLNSRPTAEFFGLGGWFQTDNTVTVNNAWTLMFVGEARENTDHTYNAVSSWGSTSQSTGVILLCRINGSFEWGLGGFGASFDIPTGITPRASGDVVFITHDGSTTRIYVNGTEEGSFTDTWNIDSSNKLRIGANVNSSEEFNGDLSALLFAQHAITAQEVTDLTTFFSDRYDIPQ